MKRTILMASLVAAQVALSTSVGHAQSADERAIETAKKYAGTTITIHTEAGLHEMAYMEYNAKLWEEATGIKLNVVGSPTNEVFAKTVQDFRGPYRPPSASRTAEIASIAQPPTPSGRNGHADSAPIPLITTASQIPA